MIDAITQEDLDEIHARFYRRDRDDWDHNRIHRSRVPNHSPRHRCTDHRVGHIPSYRETVFEGPIGGRQVRRRIGE